MSKDQSEITMQATGIIATRMSSRMVKDGQVPMVAFALLRTLWKASVLHKHYIGFTAYSEIAKHIIENYKQGDIISIGKAIPRHNTFVNTLTKKKTEGLSWMITELNSKPTHYQIVHPENPASVSDYEYKDSDFAL